MPSAANVRLVDPITHVAPSDTFVDLWRAVMPVLNVAISGPHAVVAVWPPGAPRTPTMGQDPNGPNRQGGYQHDACFGKLQEWGVPVSRRMRAGRLNVVIANDLAHEARFPASSCRDEDCRRGIERRLG